MREPIMKDNLIPIQMENSFFGFLMHERTCQEFVFFWIFWIWRNMDVMHDSSKEGTWYSSFKVSFLKQVKDKKKDFLPFYFG